MFLALLDLEVQIIEGEVQQLVVNLISQYWSKEHSSALSPLVHTCMYAYQ